MVVHPPRSLDFSIYGKGGAETTARCGNSPGMSAVYPVISTGSGPVRLGAINMAGPTTRFDRLLQLVAEGSTPATRRAAAQQIGEIQKHHPYDLQTLLYRVRGRAGRRAGGDGARCR